MRIIHAQNEAKQLTDAFILVKNDILHTNIEKKPQKIEIRIKYLSASKAQMELEWSKKITKEKIIDFIAEILEGDPTTRNIKNYSLTILFKKCLCTTAILLHT